MGLFKSFVSQTRKPEGFLGKMMLNGMNSGHVNMFRKLCMQMLKADTSVKDSLAGKRQRCAWSFPYALAVVKNWAFS